MHSWIDAKLWLHEGLAWNLMKANGNGLEKTKVTCSWRNMLGHGIKWNECKIMKNQRVIRVRNVEIRSFDFGQLIDQKVNSWPKFNYRSTLYVFLYFFVWTICKWYCMNKWTLLSEMVILWFKETMLYFQIMSFLSKNPCLNQSLKNERNYGHEQMV